MKKFENYTNTLEEIIKNCQYMRDKKVPALIRLSDRLDELKIAHGRVGFIELDDQDIIENTYFVFDQRQENGQGMLVYFFDCEEDNYTFEFSHIGDWEENKTLEETIERIKEEIKI